MTQIGAARDYVHSGFRRHRREAPQCRAKALLLGVARAFANVETVDEQHVADASGIVWTIGLAIAHQHMEAVDATGQKRRGAAPSIGADGVGIGAGFDVRCRSRHAAPARPPSMRGL